MSRTERAIRWLENLCRAMWLVLRIAFCPYESYTMHIPKKYRAEKPIGARLAWSIAWDIWHS